MERMSTLDAGFFFVEHKNAPMHIGSLMVFEGPAPAYRDIGTGRCGRRGSWRASRAAAGRCSLRCTTAWWMASAAPA
jgi:hypothetical protein